MCGDNPPYWCEPCLPDPDDVPVCGYGPRPEHAAMFRAKQQMGACDGGDNHWPPHVCTYHIRRREYYGENK